MEAAGCSAPTRKSEKRKIIIGNHVINALAVFYERPSDLGWPHALGLGLVSSLNATSRPRQRAV
jgi:hypothetical protein